MIKVIELGYSSTNTYLIKGERGSLLFDTGWAGTFPAFCRAIKEKGVKLREVGFIMISHFHPDHMGIAQEIADNGPTIVILDVQKPYIHVSDGIFAKEPKKDFIPVKDDEIKVITHKESRSFLKNLGIEGEMIYTPGHSDDSISLWLDEGSLFVGDLNPLYERELHKGTIIDKTWEKLLSFDPHTVYYGHAKTAHPRKKGDDSLLTDRSAGGGDLYYLVSRIMKYIDRGYSIEKICRKTGSDNDFVQEVNRMYLTHQNVGVQGILDRIEIRNR